MDLTGASALVTGGASGLGLATARRLAEAGATVTIVDLPTSAGADVAAELGGTFAAADVTDRRAGRRRCRRPPRRPAPCAWSSTAPASPRPPRFSTAKAAPSPLAGFEKIIRVNLIGTYNVIAQASAVMAKTDADRRRRPRASSSTPRASRHSTARSASPRTRRARAACTP